MILVSLYYAISNKIISYWRATLTPLNHQSFKSSYTQAPSMSSHLCWFIHLTIGASLKHRLVKKKYRKQFVFLFYLSATIKVHFFWVMVHCIFSLIHKNYFTYDNGVITCILLMFCHQVMSNSFAAPWTIACQAPLSVGLPRQEHWSRFPFPSQGDLPDQGMEPMSPTLAGRFFTT